LNGRSGSPEFVASGLLDGGTSFTASKHFLGLCGQRTIRTKAGHLEQLRGLQAIQEAATRAAARRLRAWASRRYIGKQRAKTAVPRGAGSPASTCRVGWSRETVRSKFRPNVRAALAAGRADEDQRGATALEADHERRAAAARLPDFEFRRGSDDASEPCDASDKSPHLLKRAVLSLSRKVQCG